jgi:tetratricopeptide (TPR) repeat protein
MIELERGNSGSTSLDRVKQAANILDAAAKFAKKSLRLSAEATSPFEQSWYAGVAAYEVREYDAAVDFLSTAYQLKSDAQVAAQLGMCYWRINDFPNSEIWIKTAIASEPKGMHQANLLNEQVSFLALYSAIQLAQGKVEAASRSVDAALAANNEPLSIRVKAHVLLAKGQGREALELLDAAITELPRRGKGFEELRFERHLVSDLLGANVEVAPFFSVSRVGSWPD